MVSCDVSFDSKHNLMLSRLAIIYGMTIREVLEMLIEDRYSVSDSHKNAARRDKAFEEYLHEQLTLDDDFFFSANKDTLHHAWTRGYNTGWTHFQTRHGELTVTSLEIE